MEKDSHRKGIALLLRNGGATVPDAILHREIVRVEDKIDSLVILPAPERYEEDFEETVRDSVEEVREFSRGVEIDITDKFSDLSTVCIASIKKALKEQRNGMKFIYDKVRGIKNGKKGEKGDKGDRGETGRGERGEKGDKGEPLNAEEVRDLLESLEGDERFDAAYIKNLPESVKRVIGTSHALWSLMDVEVSGIMSGQSIIWDGIRWSPYTPAGSGGTPVWGEVLQTQDPTGTVFTLAHLPITGTVRLFRGGAYQSVANGDYTIASAIITLAVDLQDGETLVVDYSYT